MAPRIDIQIVPSFKNIDGDLKKIAKDIADNLDKSIGDALPKGMTKAIKDAGRQASRAAEDGGEEAGERFAGHFADSLKRRLDAALRALPELDLDVTTSRVERGLRRLRSDIEKFSRKEIGVDIDVHSAVAAITKFQDRIRRLRVRARDPQLKVDLAQAQDEVDAWAEVVAAGGERAVRELRRAHEEQARIHQQAIDEDLRRERKAIEDRSRLHEQAIAEDVKRTKKANDDVQREMERAAGEAFGNTFAGRIRDLIEKSFTSLPELEIKSNTAPVQVALRSIRDELQALRDMRIGVDVDAGKALFDLAAIRQELVHLANTDPDIQVRADAVAAATRLAEIEQMAQRLDGKDVDIRVNADGRGLDGVTDSAGIALSRIESLIAASLSLGTALVPAAAAAASAIGFIGTAAASAAAGIGVMVLGFSGIGDAVKAMGKLSEDQANADAALSRSRSQVASATDSITSAERSLANVRANNAEAARRAGQAVEDAERGVARAQVQARQATLDLTRAREEERRANQDLAFDVEGLAIAQRQANLDQIRAKEELDKVLSNPRATKEQRDQARITYDQITLRIREMTVQQQRLADKQQQANKVGVEGSDRVQAAQQRVRDTTEGVAVAQRRLHDTIHAQQAQQRQAAFALAGAQQALAAAHRQAGQAAERAAVAGGEAMDNLNDAMRKLSPTGQRFARFLFGLKDEFLSLRAAAADNLLPGVQTSIENLLPFLPRFRRYVGDAAGAIGDMFAETTRFLSTDSSWRRFFSFIEDTTVPTLQRLYRIGRNVATGMVDLIMAFTPFNEDIGGGLERLTERFAKWSSMLEHNLGFQRFLAYAQENGPKVVDLIGQLVTFVGNFLEAAGPTGTAVVAVFTALARVLNTIPMGVLENVVRLMGIWAGILLIMNTRSRLMAINEAVRNRVLEAGTKIAESAQLATGRYSEATGNATAATGRFSGALRGLKGAGAVATAGVSGVVGALGGPLNAAITAAIITAGLLFDAHAKYQSKVQTLEVALGDLGDAYDRLTKSGKDAAGGVEEQLRGIIASNPEMQRAVVLLDQMGIGFGTLAAAASGSERDMQAILDVLNGEIARLEGNAAKAGSAFRSFVGGNVDTGKQLDQLRAVRQAVINNAEALGLANRAQDIANESTQKANEHSQNWISRLGPLSIQRYDELTGAYNANAQRISLLQDLLPAFGNAQSTAAQKADALRTAIEKQTSAATSAIEQQETWSQSLLDLDAAVKSNGTSLGLHTQEGLRNRDALEAAAQKTRELYLEDIASGTPMDEATKRHQDRIAALIEEARRLGLDKTETQKLIEAYGKIPENVQTVIKTKNFKQVFEELEALQFAQFALERGLSPADAEDLWKRQQRARAGPGSFAGLATGGLVHGPGTTTSDSIPVRLSRREFVQPAASVDYYGQGLMEALRFRRIPKEVMRGFATGGLVTWPFETNLSRTFIPTRDEALSKVIPKASGGIGSADMIRVLRAVFPGLALYSGYRPGSRTASGSLSYHAMTAADGDKGRAVDVPPRGDVFKWIHDNFLRATRELIWAGDPNRNIWNGQHHRYSDALLRQHGVAGQPNAHIHWAYDSGGFLPPGLSTVWNGTGRPEPVLTAPQWDQIGAVARNSHAEPREVHHWHFKDHTLDLPRLQAWQDRRDALARAGRPT